MVVSPLALAGLVVGATKILRRVELSPRVLRYEGHVGRIAVAVAMTALFVGWGRACGSSTAAPGRGTCSTPAPSTSAGLAVMGPAAWVVAQRAVGGARRAGRLLIGP